MGKHKKEAVVNKSQEKSLVVIGKNSSAYRRISFDFGFFKRESISINGFNNFYKSKKDSIDAVNDLFESINNIQLYDEREFFEPSTKRQFHYNEFKGDEVIDKIEKVLIEGYKMTREKVDEFERMYFEFAFIDGKRVIGTKICSNIFSILFLDPNHLICDKSSRYMKNKMLYSIPSVFGRVEDDFLSKEDFDINEYLQMLIVDCECGKLSSIEDVAENLRSIVQ